MRRRILTVPGLLTVNGSGTPQLDMALGQAVAPPPLTTHPSLQITENHILSLLMKMFALPLALGIFLLSSLPGVADIRLKVKNSTLGSVSKGDTRKSQRQLKIEIDNRDREDYEGVTLEWVVIARDIRNRKLSIVSKGSKLIDIPAEEEMEVTSSPYSFSKKEGEVREIRENRFRPDRPQFDVEPDSGTRYAGYIIILKKGDDILAEAATTGMKKRVAPLLSKEKKK
ncbi:MAG: hypothetical protein MK194_04800 [Roseibacillus sp.]|nr:hypothetical protein [Roseibacillus sp.]